MRNLIDRLITKAQQTPYFHLDGYMQRYWLLKPNDLKEAGEKPRRWFARIGIRLHHILRSDLDDCFHDHPFASISIVLRGGYWEVMPLDPDQPSDLDPWCRRMVWRGPGAIVLRRAKDRHLLLLETGRTCWSIFIMGKKKKTTSWGFYPLSGFIHHKKYLGIPSDAPTPNAGETVKAR
jgi:hypothetical protein